MKKTLKSIWRKKKKLMQNNVLILGIGNYLMGDEGVGCHAIKYLEELGYGNVVRLLDGGTGGFHLLSELTGYEHVILIDATLDHFDEGTVRVLRPKGHAELPVTLSAHEIGLKDLISSLTLLNAFPDLFLIAISVKDYDELRIGLSEKLEQSLPVIRLHVDRIFTHMGIILPTPSQI
jgi:hydrogenase maturation protease